MLGSQWLQFLPNFLEYRTCRLSVYFKQSQNNVTFFLFGENLYNFRFYIMFESPVTEYRLKVGTSVLK